MKGLGHEAGDKLLVGIAERLRSVLRSRDTIARLSGNEFAVLLADMSRKTDVGRILDKLAAGLSSPVQIDGHSIVPAIRIGISMPYGDEINARTLLNNAEIAMHKVDSMQGVSFRHYSQSLGEQISKVLTVEKALQCALDEGRLELHYQPQVELGSGKIVSAEALLRWMRPDGVTNYEPSEFIPLAEESGLIIPIGRWVLQRACRDFQSWQEQGLAPASIAINMSARQFEDPSIVDEIRHELRQCGMRPGQLELELTENVVQSTTSAKQIQSLAKLGVQIAIDDFGTGYSSLNYLKHLPVRKLKIDRTFMRGVCHRPLITSLSSRQLLRWVTVWA
jgi:predicted signal transduction protein with EAL and GGDEF domain